MFRKQSLVAIALSFSMNAWGADFSAADAKFALRDQSQQANLDARNAYQAIMNDQSVVGAELLRAGEGYLRTFIFEGTHYYSLKTDSGKKARKAVFNSAWTSAVEVISPEKLGFASPAYYYFKASSIAYEAEVSNVLERLFLLPLLNQALADGLATQGGHTYEGGGLLRVKAAVKGNPEAKGLPGGLYNPNEALKLVDEAISSEAFPGNAEGALFCENYRRKLMTQNELGSKAEALATAEQALKDFQSYLDDGLIPEFIRPETSDCLLTIAELKSSL
ncbi:MAG: hypothetical protein NTX25_02745 [Proteobacteria bacterium]|nr:hypothetical protein [Pseudomonadota bacterium]